jgi:1,4-alpha-glucan branching enzyme
MDKIIVYEKGDLLFMFNFHPEKSYENYQVGTLWKSDHFVIMESDEERFGGHKRLDDAHRRWYESYNQQCDGRPNSIKIYLPSRTCIILCAYENAIKIKD